MSSTFYKNVGKWIRLTRESCPIKVTQSKLANHLGVTFQQIQKYEQGRNCIPMYKFVKVCEFFNKSINSDMMRNFATENYTVAIKGSPAYFESSIANKEETNEQQ